MNYRKRQSAIVLDGLWSFAIHDGPLPTECATSAAVLEAGLSAWPCTVPGNLELDLQAVGLLPEPFYGMNIVELRDLEHTHVWYWRTFAADPDAAGEAELVFEGLDCYADVYLNGELLGACDNMLVEQVLLVGGRLRAQNELLVHIRPALDEAQRYPYTASSWALSFNYESLHVRKAPHMYGWDIMPRALSAGLWRPVRLRYRPLERLEEVYLRTLSLRPDLNSAQVQFYYRACTAGAKGDVYEIALDAECGDALFAHRQRMAFDVGQVQLNVEQPAVWWPAGRGAQNLYDVLVRVLKNGVEIDQLTLRFGIRTIKLERTSITGPEGEGEFCFYCNGERLFIKGSNWVPVDVFHSRDVARIPRILDMAEDLGINMLRCWGGNVYENDLFFDLCDQKGILVWQDFAMACAIYPQDEAFCERLADEARRVVRRLRQHACLALWAGDNECDQFWGRLGAESDPNRNVLTRQVLPEVLRLEDPERAYLPSSPYIDSVAFKAGQRYLPEFHLWGPRDYYKSDYYRQSLCHFVSEIGYHGCPAPESLERFISPERLWPPEENPEWTLHSTAPVPGFPDYTYRVELMSKQVRELFGVVPDNLPDFSFASQASQAEAKKFFIELFRGSKWRRTGILWWNLMDGWPQLSDAVVDYYFVRKLAYEFIRRAQQPLCLMLREPANWGQDLVASNDTRADLAIDYSVRDVDSGEVVASGHALAHADSVTVLERVPFSMGRQRFYLLEWTSARGAGRNHYLAGTPPFDLARYRDWLDRAGLLPQAQSGDAV